MPSETITLYTLHMKTKFTSGYAAETFKLIMVLISVGFTNFIFSQNLVINPSFETHTNCPSVGQLTTFTDQMTYATGWKTARRQGFFFHPCSTSGAGTPNNQFGTQPAATGIGYAYIMAKINQATTGEDPLGRTMICGTLSSPLVVGKTYTVSYKVSFVSESSNMAINKLGVDFSVNNTGCEWGGTLPPPPCLYPLTNTPDLWSDDIISDSENWTTLTWTYTATEPSRYIILGIFHDITQEQHLFNWPNGHSVARYYIDDVSVVEVIPCTVSLTKTDVSCYDGNNGTATATINSGNGPFTYSWSPAPGSGQGTPNPTGLSAQTYTLTASNTIGNCTATTTIIQPDSISTDLDLTHPFCGQNNGSAIITANGGTGNLNYVWDGNTPGNLTSVQNLDAGSHSVIVTDDAGCSVNRNFSLQNAGLPISVPSSVLTIVEGDSVQLSASGGSSYTWSPSVSLSCEHCSNPIARPLTTTIYTVTGTNTAGCTGTASVTIKVTFNCYDIFVPTIFSPNGDGQNDELCVMNNCITHMQFYIFNRWGEKVFESSQPDHCWNGIFKGEFSDPGAYVYRLDAILKDGQVIQRSGNLTVVR